MAVRRRTTPRAVVLALAAIAAIGLYLHPAACERHVTAAAGHICIVSDRGTAVCRGNVTTTNKMSPPMGVSFHAVTAGDDFSCGLTATNSSLLCWGGLPGGTAQLPPPSTFFIDAHAGPRHVCGLIANGTVVCFGDATSRGAVNVPPNIVFQGITSGTNYTCGVARNHSVACWGDGGNPVVAAVNTWRAITDAEHVAVGADHACYIRVNGSVTCWGSNNVGQAMPPAALATNGSVWWLAAGGGVTCACRHQ